MKNKLLFAFVALFAFTPFANATIRTVSNNFNTPGQYTDFVAAVAASVAGDTIYVHASATTYPGTAAVNKRLTIFGAGYNGKSYQFTGLSSYVATIQLARGASGTKISGLRITTLSIASDTIVDVILERNFFNGTVATSNSSDLNFNTNWIIRNNIIDGLMYASSRNNIIVSNFINNIISRGANIFTNNVLMIANGNSPFGAVSNTIFTNNIVYNYYVTPPTILTTQSGNTFSNNITFGFNGNFPGANNTGSGNIINTSPQYVRNYTTYRAFDSIPSYNWDLAVGSPGNNAGTDGTDIGVYGGSFPFINLEGVTQLPQVKQMNIINPTVPLNGNLNVNVIGIKRD